MKRVLIPTLPTHSAPVELPEDEAHHLIQVLRVRNGETIECLDGQGSKIKAIVDFQRKGKVIATALGLKESSTALLSLPIQLEMSVIKGDAMEWTVEKAVELGVRTFVPVITAHSVVQLERKGPEAFQERWQKIADQSLKQCGRLDQMKVALPIALETLLMEPAPVRLWLEETKRATHPSIISALNEVGGEKITRGVSILVGPEGGFSERERLFLSKSGVASVSLGPWILRAETAALFATSLVSGSMR
jgi:16S rRNA (uracil1498-N3)-methyltransferase